MWLRRILIAAAVAAPMALIPADAFAQAQGGANRGGSSFTQLPPGIERNGGDRELPPGLARRYAEPAPAPQPEPAVEPEPEPQPEPEPEPEPCATTVVMIGGFFYAQDCHGNLFPL